MKPLVKASSAKVALSTNGWPFSKVVYSDKPERIKLALSRILGYSDSNFCSAILATNLNLIS